VADIISVATALPEFRHEQENILHFMQNIYGIDDMEKRKLAFLYRHCGINTRYSVINDYGLGNESWSFFPKDKPCCFPKLEQRMQLYQHKALPLSVKAIERCINNYTTADKITHLITVSCTGMSAPGLDLEIMEAMNLSPSLFRTSVNFMGCYAAIHALKLAKMICDSTKLANVVIVATELCTLHFQEEYTMDNAASSLLFADGCAAVLVSNYLHSKQAVSLKSFYSQVAFKGKKLMAWELSSKGFLMTLSGYVPQLIEEDITALTAQALQQGSVTREEISYWCIHPGGKKILDVIGKQLKLEESDLD
jgi:predicted naringenin-chalcone synthase